MYTNGASPARIDRVLNAGDCSVLLMAHLIPQTQINTAWGTSEQLLKLHCWITVVSSAGEYTISFEPSDGNPQNIATWKDQLVTRFNADLGNINPLPGVPVQSLVNPHGPTPNVIVPINLTQYKPSFMTNEQFARTLTGFAQSYNQSETYKPTGTVTSWNPASPEDPHAYNSNSAIQTILQLSGVDTNEIQTVVLGPGINNYPPFFYNTGNVGVGSALDIASKATSWLHTMPITDFTAVDNYNYHVAYTSDAVAAFVGGPYLRNLILNQPFLANILKSDPGTALAALSTMVNSVEQIQKGGVLNVITGGLDLIGSATRLGLLPTEIKGFPLYNWIQNNGGALLNAVGDVQSIIDGFQAGGISGAINVGTAAENLVWLDHPLLTGLAQDLGIGAPELALGIAVVAALVTLAFGGNHDNPAQMPDKYDTARFMQYVGELQGSAATAYAPPYDPTKDPVQTALGHLSMLNFIQQWVGDNINASNAEVHRLAEKLLPLYGDAITGANGTLQFQHNIGNESVTGGSESGTYVSLFDDVSQVVGEIRALDAIRPNDVILPKIPLQPPGTDYGNLAWNAFYLPNNALGYWAQSSDGSFYYFGPDSVLYHDTYSGAVHSSDKAANAVGYVPTYDFSLGGNQMPVTSSSAYYGGY